jgi:hypothetical protein
MVALMGVVLVAGLVSAFATRTGIRVRPFGFAAAIVAAIRVVHPRLAIAGRIGATLVDLRVHANVPVLLTARRGRSGRSGLCGSTGGRSGSGGVCTGSPGRVGSAGVGGGGPGGTYSMSLLAKLVFRGEPWKMFIGYLARLDVAVEADRRPLDGPCTTGSARKGDRMASGKFVLRDE